MNAARFPQVASEFPDFDQSTLPEIPAHWVESSWHNDACPSFMVADWRDGKPYIQVFIDWANPEDAATAMDGRFGVNFYAADGDCEDYLMTDDWPAALAKVDSLMREHGVERDDWNAILAHIAKESGNG